MYYFKLHIRRMISVLGPIKFDTLLGTTLKIFNRFYSRLNLIFGRFRRFDSDQFGWDRDLSWPENGKEI